MPAVSKKQQRFFGMVRAAQKGEMKNPSKEVLDVADDISMKDAKKFAKTKHKGLPEKKKVDECWKTHKKVGMKMKGGKLVPDCRPKNEEVNSDQYPKLKRIIGSKNKPTKPAVEEGWSDKYKKSIDCDNPKGFSQRAHCQGKKKKMQEESNPRIPRKPGQPAGSKKHSDLYTDENPKGTIHGLGFKDVATAKASVSKIRKSSRSHAHKIQAAVAMEQRAREMGKTSEAAVYRKFINTMKKKTKRMNEGALSMIGRVKKKREEKQPQKAMDAGARAKRKLARKVHAKYVSGSEDNVPDDIREEGLRDWFGKSSGTTKSGRKVRGWVQVGGKYDGKPCARQPGQKTTPKCVSSSKRRSMSDKERDSAARRKRAADPNQPQKSGAAAPTNVSTDPKKKMKESFINEAKDKKGKGSGTKDACYHKVKSRYSVWPSAYASGALVKCRKVGAANWGNSSKKEEFEGKMTLQQFQEKCWKGYEKKGMKTMFGKRYPNCVKKKATRKEEVQVEAKVDQGRSDYGKASIRNYRRMGPGHGEPAMFDPENKRGKLIDKRREEHKARRGVKGAKVPAYKKEEVQTEGVKGGDNEMRKMAAQDRAAGKDKRLSKKQGEKNVANMLRKIEMSPSHNKEEVEMQEATPAWQRKEGKRESGGLNQKGVDSYRRANPGSKLKTAVTTKPSKLKKGSKAAKRRKSFCSRMKGMKAKLTSAKTARDPDSRINKSLRKWNCSYEPEGTPIMEKEDKAFNFVLDKIRKEVGKSGYVSKDNPRKPQSAAEKAKVRAHQAKVDKENAAARAKDPSQGRYPKG